MKVNPIFHRHSDIAAGAGDDITYAANSEGSLETEISRYVVTEDIESQLDYLLGFFRHAIESGDNRYASVWCSGVSGCGKTSFTKYLGLALDDQVNIDGVPFLEHFQKRLHLQATKKLLDNVARRTKIAVFMLDLAHEMKTEAPRKTISTILYSGVTQWARDTPRLTDESMDARVCGMIELLRRESGKQNVVFMLDNAGQYVCANDALMIDLVHLARSIRWLGDGKVFIIATSHEPLPNPEAIAGTEERKLHQVKGSFSINLFLHREYTVEKDDDNYPGVSGT